MFIDQFSETVSKTSNLTPMGIQPYVKAVKNFFTDVVDTVTSWA
jgi:hypothetical protein